MSQQQPPLPNEDHLVALGRALQTLREEENADVLIETTLNYLNSEFQYRLIWIGLYDRLEHRLFGKGGITPTGDTAFLKQQFYLTPGDVLEQVVIQQKLVGIPDLRDEIRAGEWRRVARECGIQGTIVYPLRCKDRCFGVTLLGSQQWGVSPRPAEKAQLSLLLGGLAAALYQIEVEWQRSATKHPDQPLFQTLDQLSQVPLLEQRLEAVVTMTQQFVAPTRTNLYWYSPERRYFWHRLGNQQSVWRMGDSIASSAGLTVAEANDFYKALAGDRLVTIGAGRSLLGAESTERLLGRLKARSLLAAPIRVKGELLGFLAVEDNEPRIWEEAETKYVRAMAQLVALVAGSEQMQSTLEQTQKDTHFAAEIARAIRSGVALPHASSNSLSEALAECGRLLGKRLDTDRFLVLQEEDNGEFTPIFGTQPPNRRPFTTPLAPLSATDRESLFNSAETLTIEDLEEDWRLLQWRESLVRLGVRSLLVCPMFAGNNADKLCLLVVAQSMPRTWNAIDRELAYIVAQQINLLLTLSSHSESVKQSFLSHQTLTSGLSTLSLAPQDPVQLERTWLQYLATLLECPLALLISWMPESTSARIAAAVVTDPRFALPPNLALPVVSNPLIQKSLATRGFWSCSVAELDATTRQWLSSPDITQVLIIALHTDRIPTTAIILLATSEVRQWSPHLLRSLETLTAQFTWFRYYRHYQQRSIKENDNLQKLNWYKHRCMEALHQSCLDTVSALLEESQNANPQSKIDPPLPPLQKGGNPKSKIEQMRQQHLLHQLEKTLSLLTPVLTEEQWQLSVKPRPLPLAGLLKRSLRRVEPLYRQRQLVLKVHEVDNKSVYGDRLKLECILFELLVTSCVRARPGSWINLFENSNVKGQNSKVELIITESERLDDCLQAIASSPPVLPPTRNLKICQQLLRSWGGDLQFYQLEAEHYSLLLLLPLAK